MTAYLECELDFFVFALLQHLLPYFFRDLRASKEETCKFQCIQDLQIYVNLLMQTKLKASISRLEKTLCTFLYMGNLPLRMTFIGLWP